MMQADQHKRLPHNTQTSKSRVRASFLAALMCSVSMSNIVFTVPAFADTVAGEVIQDIRVEGNKHTDASLILNQLKLSQGSAFNQQDIDDSLANVFATGLFSDVQLLRSGSTLVVKVVEKPQPSAATPVVKEKQNSALMPRAETNFRLGNQRSTAMLEAWMPVTQTTDSVLYADVRLMTDDSDNREGNLGIGYRAMTPDHDAVVGTHLWLDRRRTERGSIFHQVAAGMEIFTDDFEIRANAYQPFSKTYRYNTPNTGQANPYLLNSGIFYDTNGVLLEKPLRGADFEIGLPIEGFPGDSLRIYGGGYAFTAQDVDSVYGPRARIAAGITPDIELGARLQHDHQRGTQGFLEATFRFPMGAKPSARTGLRSRLAESPERDIDIVSGDTVADTGLAKPVLSNFTGEAQRVIHVDNTGTPDGTGSADKPFNTLAAADAAADRAGDVIYVHRGDGTSTGMNQGVVLDQAGQWLMGSGSAFIFDPTQFQTPGANFATGTIIAPAGLAPVITNTQAEGDGIVMVATATGVSGVTVQDASRHGIAVIANVGRKYERVTIRDVTASENTGAGVLFFAHGVGTLISNSTMSNVTANANGSTGVYAVSFNDGLINHVAFDHIITSNNTGYGFVLEANSNSRFTNATATNLTAQGNNIGVYLNANSTSILSASLQGVTATGNTGNGIYIDDETTETFTADLGGGTLGSTGGNRVFGNTGTDLRVDVDGLELKAENNWWGDAAGLQPGRVTLDDGSTVDSSPFLTSDPGF